LPEVKMRGFKSTVRVDEAIARFFSALPSVKPAVESVLTLDILDRILSEDVMSQVDVPPFDTSAVDGYAVHAEDTFGASSTNPSILTLIGEIGAGDRPDFDVKRGEAAKTATGAVVPKGADAVVMLEYTETIDPHHIEIWTPATPGENVTRKGEDVHAGEIVLKRGVRIRPQDVGIFIRLGKTAANVVKKPMVSVLSTGDELVETMGDVEAGKTIDVNRPILLSMIREAGAIGLDKGIVNDQFEDIKRKMEESLAEADVVVVTGGTSVGARDLVPEVVNSIGKPGMLIHGVSMRPGMPTGLGVVDGKPVLSLPGNPVAAMIAFKVFVKPLISRLTEAQEELTAKIKGRLTRRIASVQGFRTFNRVLVRRLGDQVSVEPIRLTGSGILTSMTKANGILVIPEDVEGYEAGEEVEVSLLRPVEEG
jgi:molybdopterin molybdotransferase